MAIVNLPYYVNTEWAEKHLLKTGEDFRGENSWALDLAKMPEDLRRRFIAADKRSKALTGYALGALLQEWPTLAEPLEGKGLAEASELIIKAYEDLLETYKKPDSLEALEAKNNDKTEMMRRWIAKHGSDHLKEAYLNGYGVKGLYVKERAALEAPAFTPVLASQVNKLRKDRVNPTATAINLEKEANRLSEKLGTGPARIVWVDGLIRDGIEIFRFLGGETIEIRDYLDDYVLLQPVNSYHSVEAAFQRISRFLHMGVGLREAMETVRDTTVDIKLKHRLSQVLKELDEGVSKALDRYPDTFPPSFVKLIRVGEMGGTLNQALNLAVLELKELNQ